MISSVCGSIISVRLFSFSIKRVARWGRDIFTHKSLNEEGASFLFDFWNKKSGLAWKQASLIKTIRVLQRILTVFVKSKQLSKVFLIKKQLQIESVI